MREKKKQSFTIAEVDELVNLYNAWFAVLLRALGTGEYRVSREEFREGLGNVQCNLLRDEDTYVIVLSTADGTPEPASDEGEVLHDGEEK